MIFLINEYVKINGTNMFGTIENVNKSIATINVNGKQLKINIKSISKMEESEINNSLKSKVTYKYKADKPYTISLCSKPETELMIRHQDSITAMQNVEKFLDTAYINRVTEVRIIHGKKGGVLRKALHDLLASHPHVSHYELGDYYSGQYGVTIVKLKILN